MTKPHVKLETANGDKVRAAISALHKTFKYIGHEFMDTDFIEDVSTPPNGEIQTLCTLFFGQQA